MKVSSFLVWLSDQETVVIKKRTSESGDIIVTARGEKQEGSYRLDRVLAEIGDGNS